MQPDTVITCSVFAVQLWQLFQTVKVCLRHYRILTFMSQLCKNVSITSKKSVETLQNLNWSSNGLCNPSFIGKQFASFFSLFSSMNTRLTSICAGKGERTLSAKRMNNSRGKNDYITTHPLSCRKTEKYKWKLKNTTSVCISQIIWKQARSKKKK